jgi:hypothetical protein
MFDIFNEYPVAVQDPKSKRNEAGIQRTVPHQNSAEQKQELITLNMDVEKIKLQLKEVQRAQTLSSI